MIVTCSCVHNPLMQDAHIQSVQAIVVADLEKFRNRTIFIRISLF